MTLKPEDQRFVGRLVAQEVAKAAGTAAPSQPAPSGYTGNVTVDDGTGTTQTLTFANGILKTVA